MVGQGKGYSVTNDCCLYVGHRGPGREAGVEEVYGVGILRLRYNWLAVGSRVTRCILF